MAETTLASQIKKLHETNPELSQSDIAGVLGCSVSMVSMVLSGKRGVDDEPAEVDNSEEEMAAAELAMAKARQNLMAQHKTVTDPKDVSMLADAALKNARTWATFSGKATNRSSDRDEDEMTREEAKAILAAMHSQVEEHANSGE